MSLIKIGKEVPIYGDGTDGEIVRTSSGTENGIIQSTRYELQSGVSREVSDGRLIIQAKKEIVIDGTLFGSAGGGSGSTDYQVNGENGQTGLIGVNGSGGAGQSGGADGDPGGPGAGGGGGGLDDNYADGSDGGDSIRTTSLTEELGFTHPLSSAFGEIWNTKFIGGSAGGGGGVGRSGGAGGDGGDGGALVVLIAPRIVVNGEINVPGKNGKDGEAYCGGGGGGSGGLIVLLGKDAEFNGTYDVSPGSGGAGGSGDTNNGAGGDGGDGVSGDIYIISE